MTEPQGQQIPMEELAIAVFQDKITIANLMKALKEKDQQIKFLESQKIRKD